jgi:polysaccharide biosynthesis protein PslH
MKILFISSRFPYPVVRGEQVIMYNRLQHLAKNHDITLLTIYQNDTELKYLDKLRPFYRSIQTVKISKLKSVLNLLIFGLFSDLPFQILYYRSNKLMRKLKMMMDSDNFDVVHAYMLRTAEYARHINKPKVLDLIDSMGLSLGKRLNLVKHPQKLLYKKELKRIKLYEKEIVHGYDRSIVVSDNDRDFINSEKVMTIPLGIDTLVYKRNLPLPDNKTIIFSGHMAYHPNEHAIIWFLKNCLELIKKSVPEVKIKIVGIKPGNAVKNYHDGKTVFVTGFVESIVDEMITSQVAIAPMQSGYGMHIKVLEAMACELPVVCSSLALGTIRAINGRDVVIADEVNDFADRCVELLLNHEMARNIGIAARDLITKEYGWESHAKMIENLYNRLTSRIT